MELKMLSFVGCALLLHCVTAHVIGRDVGNDLSDFGNLLQDPLETNSVHHHRSHGVGKKVHEKQLNVLPLGYIEFSRHNGIITAFKFNRTKVTWNEARQTCQEEGAFLGYPTNSREARVVYNQILKDFHDGGMWIGLHDLFEEGDWVTVLGEKVNRLKYTNWAITEPNNYNNNEDCAEIYDKDGKWYDTDCQKKLFFLCKAYARY